MSAVSEWCLEPSECRRHGCIGVCELPTQPQSPQDECAQRGHPFYGYDEIEGQQVERCYCGDVISLTGRQP